MSRSRIQRGRLPAIAFLIALLGSLLPAASVSAAAVFPATGGSAISVDTFGTTNYVTISGPGISEAAPGELALGTTTILNAPAGFRFNPGVGNTTVGGGGCTGTPLAGTLSVTASTATFTVTQASAGGPCILNFTGLQVQANATTPGSGNLTKTGTSAAPGGATNYGTLTRVAGAVAQLIYLTQPSPNNNGGAAFGTQPNILARDQYNNVVVGAPVTLAITPGTGAAGAVLTCTTNPLNTNGAGQANFAGEACRIDLAGSYRLRASNGSVFADSGNFNVNVGPASKIIFKSYPGATTPPLLNPQPVIAVTDAGGNTVTTFPPSAIQLSINKAAGTFSCTSGLSVVTVNGVATYTGCTQTVADTGYQLTGTIGVFNVLGPAFAVTPPTLAFIAGPGAPTAGQPFPTNVQVAIQNGGVTLTSGIAATIQLSIGTNPSAGTLTCTGGTSATTVSGVATFTGCSINNAGNGYTLTATASNVVPAQTIGPATSAPFNVATATPASIVLNVVCSAPNAACPVDLTKSPPQANIKLPQSLSEGITLTAHMGASGANRLVAFQFSKDQVTWTQITQLTTDGSGFASTFYRPPDNRYYRAVFAGATDLGAANSNVIRVVVRQLVFLRPTGCTISASPCSRGDGTTIRFAAIARPNKPELPTQQAVFTIQRRVGSTWTTIATETENVSKASGEAEIDVTFNQPGTYRIRVNLLPTSVNANSFPTPYEYYRIT